MRYSYTHLIADGLVRNRAGLLHTLSFGSTEATTTAGLLTVYDSLTESGPIIFSTWLFATSPSRTIQLDVFCGTGIFVGFDATLAGASVTVAHR